MDEIVSYAGVPLVQKEAGIMKDIGRLVGQALTVIPEIKPMEIGFTARDNHVTGLAIWARVVIGGVDEIIDLALGLLHLESLFFGFMLAERISPKIGELKNLKHLNLSGNAFKEIPSEIGNLSKLESLVLSSNQLRSIPDSIGSLSNLQ